MTAVPKPRDIRANARPARKKSPVEKPSNDFGNNSGRELGEILVRLGRLDPEGLERIVAAHKEKGGAFGAAAERLGLLKPDEVQAAVAIRHGYLAPQPQALALPKELVLLRRPYSPQSEQFRLLRTRLLTTQADALDLFCVIGAGCRSRADFVALNLAASLAQLKRRVLLVDAGLRAPCIAKMFGLADKQGLSAALEGVTDLEEVVAGTPVVNLSLLPAGPRRPSPQEILAGKSLHRVLDEARSRFDTIIVLSPPLGAVADGQLLLAATQRALIVVRRGEARASDLIETQSVVRQLGVNTLGAVVIG
jgi:capsular exopolysaccharide synthesis family protein